MLVSIGSRGKPEDLVGLLLDCHQRIRNFTGLAEEVGRRDDLSEADVIDACRRCTRYFAEALPLHVEDEEQSLFPRLHGKRRELDEGFAAMHAQHAAHAPLLGDLLERLRDVRAQPAAPELRERLRATAATLELEFEEHLTLEERLIFPAVRVLLASDEQRVVLEELRARRRRVAG